MSEQWGLPPETVAKTQRSFFCTSFFIFSSIAFSPSGKILPFRRPLFFYPYEPSHEIRSKTCQWRRRLAMKKEQAEGRKDLGKEKRAG
jgi:hypothetical protein